MGITDLSLGRVGQGWPGPEEPLLLLLLGQGIWLMLVRLLLRRGECVAKLAKGNRLWRLIAGMAQPIGHKLWSQWVQDVGLLEFHTIQVSTHNGPRDAIQASVLVAALDEAFPELAALSNGTERDWITDHSHQ